MILIAPVVEEEDEEKDDENDVTEPPSSTIPDNDEEDDGNDTNSNRSTNGGIGTGAILAITANTLSGGFVGSSCKQYRECSQAEKEIKPLHV